MGDPSKLLLLEQVLRVMKEDNLLDLVNQSGKVLKNGLHEIEKEFKGIINNVRGRGTFIAYDAHTTETRDKINVGLKTNGKCKNNNFITLQSQLSVSTSYKLQ